MKENTHCKTNLHIPYHKSAFHQKPLLQAEILSERCGCSLGRRQSLHSPTPPLQNTWGLQCSHFAPVVSSQWMQQAWPTLTCLQHGQHTPAPSENMVALGLQILAMLQSSVQPLCLQPEPLLLLQWLGGSSPALCFISWLTTMELACCQALFQSTATGGWKVRYRLWLSCCFQR